MKKHYKTLGLNEGASQEEIQAAFDRLSKELNPKNNDNQDFFAEEYKKVEYAYNSLYNSSVLATDAGANQFKEKADDLKVNYPKKSDKKTNIKNMNSKKYLILGFVLILIVFSYSYLNKSTDLNSLTYTSVDSQWYSSKISNDVVYNKINMLPFTGEISNKEYSGSFKNGKKIGTHKNYGYDGMLISKGDYNDGLLDGLFQSWSSDGQLLTLVTYDKGQRTGMSKKWNEQGQLIKVDYNEGSIVEYLRDYLITSKDLNIIEGEYSAAELDIQNDYNFIIINIDGQFCSIITKDNIVTDRGNTFSFSIGDVKAYLTKASKGNKYNSKWIMANRSIIEVGFAFFETNNNSLKFELNGGRYWSYNKKL